MAKTKISPRKKGSQERAKDTVNYIVEATTQLLNEGGFKQLSTNKIVERAGISIGSLYQYFPNKESILHYVVEKLFNNLADDMVNTIAGLDLDHVDLKTAVELLIDRFMSNHEPKKNVFRQFLMSAISVEHLKFMLKNDVKIAHALKEKFQHYGDELAVQDWDSAIFFILYALKGIQFGILFGNPPFDKINVRDEVSKMIYGYLKSV